MIKRLFDLLGAILGLLVLSPVLVVVMVLIWLQDFQSPFYVAPRVSRGGGRFRMVKLRSMVVNAASSGVNSTAANDRRITPIGKFVRRTKLDEIMQLWNVLEGDMSLVGPRPQVETDASLYTNEEWRMLSVRPGITDLASIVFADEGNILQGSDSPDLLYNQVIRPWKSRLALLYVDHRTFWADLKLIWLTVIGAVSRPAALRGVQRLLSAWQADELVLRMATRQEPLLAYPPPGASEVVSSYPGNQGRAPVSAPTG
jgi:lipopolysaccharide/colanic/teichoic acid biosynthesis glycosyltransferase